MISVRVRQPDWKGVIEGLVPPLKKDAANMLEEVGQAMVSWLESRTAAERGWIAREPGGLANSFFYRVTETPQGAKLRIGNSKFYAVILEHRDGLFVVHGITDPGGPVEEKLTEIGKQYGMRVVRSG
jgi:hypothetical protein